MADTRKAAESTTANAFETTLSSQLGASDLTINVASTTGLSSPCYIVVEPDSATQREYIFIDSTVAATSFTTTTADNRYLSGSAAGSGLTHPSGSKVRVAPMKQHFEDIFDALGKVVDTTYSSATAGEVKLDVSEATVNVAADEIPIIDADDSSKVKKESVADLVSGISGDGLSATSGQLDLDLNELTSATVDVANDSVAIIDATDNSSKKETIADVVSGIAGEGLIASSGQLNASTGRKNYLINGNFDIWERGTSLTGQTASKYLADRWLVNPSGTTYDYDRGTFTVGQTDVPNNPKFYADFTITSADDNFRPEQRIEDVNTLAGQTITISFWAKYTTNAPTSFNTVIRQHFGSGGSSDVFTTFITGQTLTTSWQKFTVTGTVPSISGKTVGSGSYLVISPFYNTNNETFDVQIAQVQVEKGSIATDFEYRPIAEELDLCQRYFQLYTDQDGTEAYINYGIGHCNSATQVRVSFSYIKEMRTKPSFTTTGNFRLNGSITKDVTSMALVRENTQKGDLQCETSSGWTAGEAASLQSNNDSTATLELDAEL